MGEDESNRLPKPIQITDIPFDSVEACDAVVYDADVEAYRASFDDTTESIPLAVVATVAAVAETDPEQLPQLNSVVDPEALASLVESTASDTSRSRIRVSFTIGDYHVTVHNGGTIDVEPPQGN